MPKDDRRPCDQLSVPIALCGPAALIRLSRGPDGGFSRSQTDRPRGTSCAARSLQALPQTPELRPSGGRLCWRSDHQPQASPSFTFLPFLSSGERISLGLIWWIVSLAAPSLAQSSERERGQQAHYQQLIVLPAQCPAG